MSRRARRVPSASRRNPGTGGAGRARRLAARPLQVGVQHYSPFPRQQGTQPQGSPSRAATIISLKQTSDPVALLFTSPNCHPRIKSKVLGLVFMALHNRDTTYLSNYLSL